MLAIIKCQYHNRDKRSKLLNGIQIKLCIYIKNMVIKKPKKRLREHGKHLHIQ